MTGLPYPKHDIRTAGESCARASWVFLCRVGADMPFSGRGRGHTQNTLSPSTSVTVGRRFLAWFTSTLILSLSPLFLLGLVASHNPVLQFFEHDPQLVGLGLSLVSVYWGLTLLVLGMYSADVRHENLIVHRTNHCPSMVCLPSNLIHDQQASAEPSFPHFIYAAGPDAEVFERTTVYGVRSWHGPNIYSDWYVMMGF